MEEEKTALDNAKEIIVYPCTIGIIGKKFSGKSNLLLNLIDKNKFDTTFIITQSIHTGNLNDLLTDEENLFDEVDNKFFDMLLDFQKDNPKSRVCLIFDDFINSERTLRDIKRINTLASSGRNFNITQVYSSQVLNALPPILRKNLEYIFFGRQTYKSIKDVCDEFSTHDKPPKTLAAELIKLSSNKRHDWIWFNERESEWNLIPEENISVKV